MQHKQHINQRDVCKDGQPSGLRVKMPLSNLCTSGSKVREFTLSGCATKADNN